MPEAGDGQSDVSLLSPEVLGVSEKLSFGSVGEEGEGKNSLSNHFLVLMKGLALKCLN